MQMKHRKLIQFLLVLFLAGGCADIYFICTTAIPRLYAGERPNAPAVPVQKESLPNTTPPITPPSPVQLTLLDTDLKPAIGTAQHADDSEASSDSSQSSTDEAKSTVSEHADSETATAHLETTSPPVEPVVEAPPVAPLSPAAQPQTATVSKNHNEAPPPIPDTVSKALPRATEKQLPGSETLRFGPNRTLLWRFEKKTLRNMAKVLMRFVNVHIRLVGHADSQEKNPQELGMNRALAAKAFLEKEGVHPELIEVESVGAKKPSTKGTSALERKKNRRVRVRLFIKDTM